MKFLNNNWRLILSGAALMCGLATLLLLQQPGYHQHGGSQLYQDHCSQCHQENGHGFRDLYPSIVDSRYFAEQLEDLPCLITQGSRGSIMNKNGNYHVRMPPITNLDHQQMARLTDYLVTRWGTTRSTTLTPDSISTILAQCPH